MSARQSQLSKAADILQRVGSMDIQTMVIHGEGSDQWVYLYTHKIDPKASATERGRTVVPPLKAEVAAEALAETAFKRWPDVTVYVCSLNGELTETKWADTYRGKGGGI